MPNWLAPSHTASPPGAPATDPTLDAYLKALGFSDDQARAEETKREADVNAQTALRAPEIDYQSDLARQGVESDTLGRGVWASGERQLDLAKAAHAQQYAQASLQLNASQSIGDAQLALARALADNEARRQTANAQSGVSS